ncbi:MAG: hypothetical protein RID15_08960 [Marinovum algicola]|uniref:hypothetical protein n=1 Tax=Marinovum algicola TaxID=42444 RepID=UPI0032EC547A
MFKRLFTASLVFGAVALGPPALAQSTCMPRDICGTARMARAFSVDLQLGLVRSYVRPFDTAHSRWPR